MGENTKIEWTDATWSPIRAAVPPWGKVGWHCEHVSEGCRNCYAEAMNRRLGTGFDFKPGNRVGIDIFLDEKMLLAPLRWKTPRRIFVNSMTDTFAEFMKDEWLDRMFAVMALAPRHTFQVLTKRPERMRRYFSRSVVELCERIAATVAPSTFTGADLWTLWPLPNIWIGVSAEDQTTADERIPLLLQTPAAVRFVSLEPLLGPIDLWNGDPDPRLGGHKATRTFLGDWWEPGDNPKGPSRHGVDWIIAGGESGPHARPAHPDWFRSLRDQCAAADVPFHFKQWGEFREAEKRRGGYAVADRATTVLNIDGSARSYRPDGWEPQSPNDPTALMERYGKKAAGRLLDGRTHDGMPSALRETAQNAIQPTEPS